MQRRREKTQLNLTYLTTDGIQIYTRLPVRKGLRPLQSRLRSNCDCKSSVEEFTYWSWQQLGKRGPLQSIL